MGLHMLPSVEPAYGLASAVLTPPMRFGLRWTIEGAHLIPVRGPVILASNHVSYLDPIVLAYVAQSRGRKVRFLAKAELFQHKVLGPLLRQWRQIPVQRASVDAASSLTAAEDAIGQGECVVIFPEGTISLDLDPMPGKSGAARLAAATGVKITPVGLWGAQRILFKGRKPAWQTGVAESVVVGTPFRVRADENVGAATTRLMEEVACAVARARAIYPQRPATDDDPWWTRTPASAFRHVGAGSGA
jgi:1-acyl-sn-glycerol-3-phosphate acyltransferase